MTCAGGIGDPPLTHGLAESPALPASILASRVLVIEDEAMIAWTLESLLEDLGFVSISIAASGEEAIAMAEPLRPGLVLSDINLGPRGIDGISASATIRAACGPRFVFISGYASAEAQGRIARDVPGAGVVRKPIGLEGLRHAIADVFGAPTNFNPAG